MSNQQEPVFKAVTEFHFRCAGLNLAIDQITPTFLHLYDTRMNGQEDTHMYGSMSKASIYEEWKWDETEGETFSRYESPEEAQQILDFINKYYLELLRVIIVFESNHLLYPNHR